jgi:hypothetical protein
LQDRIRVYVSSFEISTFDYVDKESVGHPCVTSRHGEDIFAKFKHLPERSWDGYLSDNQLKAVNMVDEFCKENGLEYEVVDIASVSFVSRMKFMFKGIKAPTISFKGKKIEGVPTEEDLKVLVAK